MKSGYMVDCWQDYVKRLPVNSRNAVKQREDLIEFLQVGPGTVRKYMNGDVIQGLPLIRLRVFLSLKGYNVLELGVLDPFHLTVVEMVAFDVISLETVMSEIGYTSSSSALVFLKGNSKLVLKERVAAANNLVKKHREDLKAAKELWAEKIGHQDNTPKSVPEPVSAPPQNVKSPRNGKEFSDDEIIFIGLSKALGPVAARILDESTPEDRRRLRDKVGAHEIFGLSTSLNRLCSEAANTQYAGRTRDEQPTKH